MAQQDYYRILGVAQDADAAKIKEAYRGLAFTYHPDRNSANPDSADMMKQINEAYAVLSNSEKRTAYDAMRARFGESAYGEFRRSYTEQDIFSGSDVYQVFEEMAKSFGFRGVDDIFSDFYGPGFKRFEFNRKGLHAKGFIYRGGPGRGRFGKHRRGLMAGGAPPGVGRLAQYLLQKLTGVSLPEAGADIHDTIRLSESLASSGGPYAYHHRRRSKKLVVNVPAGVRDGQLIRLAHMGASGKNGGATGDLYLKVKLQKPLLKKAKDFIVAPFRR